MSLQIINEKKYDFHLAIEPWSCKQKDLIGQVNCAHPIHYGKYYFWTRYPLNTTRMWNLLSIFDIPAYVCFFSSLALTVALLKLYSYFGVKTGLNVVTEEFILVPLR